MTTANNKVPIWYWIVAVLLLIWNGMGILNYFQHLFVTEEALLDMSENQRILFESFPWWVIISFALAVFGGAAGAIALLLRKRLATILFIASAMGIIVQNIHSLMLGGKMTLGASWVYLMSILLVIVGGFSIWIARFSERKGWIN